MQEQLPSILTVELACLLVAVANAPPEPHTWTFVLRSAVEAVQLGTALNLVANGKCLLTGM